MFMCSGLVYVYGGKDAQQHDMSSIEVLNEASGWSELKFKMNTAAAVFATVALPA